jgi:signal peptidase II
LKKDNLLFILVALVVIIMDQASKFIISGYISYYQSIPVIDGVLRLVHVRNRGMAFGLMNRPDSGISFYFLVSITIVAILLILYWFTKIKHEDRRLLFGLSLILGGAIGNLIDRIRIKEVIDFVDIYIGSHHWPAFNVADSAITIGTLWIAMNIIFSSPPDAGEAN